MLPNVVRPRMYTERKIEIEALDGFDLLVRDPLSEAKRVGPVRVLASSVSRVGLGVGMRRHPREPRRATLTPAAIRQGAQQLETDVRLAIPGSE